jgi:hypothetical protein
MGVKRNGYLRSPARRPQKARPPAAGGVPIVAASPGHRTFWIPPTPPIRMRCSHRVRTPERSGLLNPAGGGTQSAPTGRGRRPWRRPRWLITLGVPTVIYCPVRSTPGVVRYADGGGDGLGVRANTPPASHLSLIRSQ